MPPANFHRYCKWKDRIHVLYVFSILPPFIRCINYTCRHNISREIYFYTNPTHKRLGKMGGRSIEKTNEIRTDIKTRTLFSRSSTDIYADIYTVYGRNSMSFSTVCRWVRKFSADVGPVISAPKCGRYKSASSLKIVVVFLVKSDARYTSQLIADMFGISKASSLRFWRNILKLKKESTRWAPNLLNEEQKCMHVTTASKLLKRIPRYGEIIFMHVVVGDESWIHFLEPHQTIRNPVWLNKNARRPCNATRITSA